MTMADDQKKVPLSDRQHPEMLLFAGNNLQDLRDVKADQRQAVVGGLALLGALVGLWEKLDSAPGWTLCVVAVSIAAVMLGAGALVVALQRKLLRFRRRQQRILDHHFVLLLEPITGSPRAYGSDDESGSFSLMSDLVPLYLGLLVGAAVVAFIWILAS
jgi:hypothetical protein